MEPTATIIQLTAADLPWGWAVTFTGVEGPGAWRALIAGLKLVVPMRSRKWDPDGRRWLLRSVGNAEDVADLARMHGLTVHHDGHADERGDPDPWAVLWLRPGAPDYVIDAAYRAIAKHLHPDAGGDHLGMVRINAAVEQLRGE